MKKIQIVIGAMLSSALLLTTAGQAQAPASSTVQAGLPSPAPLHITKLIMIDTQVGTGEELKNGDVAQMHYTGWLYNHKEAGVKGLMFDTSKNTGNPLSFMVGGRQVIRGWDNGVLGMKVGGKRTLYIPAYLAYSTTGSTNIPPNSHLVFEIELVGITK